MQRTADIEDLLASSSVLEAAKAACQEQRSKLPAVMMEPWPWKMLQSGVEQTRRAT